MRTKPNWTIAELSHLKKIKDNTKLDKLAEIFNRSKSAIYQKIASLEHRKKSRSITKPKSYEPFKENLTFKANVKGLEIEITKKEIIVSGNYHNKKIIIK